MASTAIPRCPPDYGKKVGFVLQGGGALGSYQAGVVEALTEAGYHPDWLACISIGAINGAIIAGNPPERRIERLRDFWETVTAAAAPGLYWPPGACMSAAWSAILNGQNGFFSPRPPSEWWFGRTPISYYDTSALLATLEKLVDFDLINSGRLRFSVGAAQVETGDFVYFDSAKTRITAAHVMASGALPPAFEPVKIGDAHYWDGGLISNTPLQYAIDTVPRRSSLIFQIDLFNPDGPLPTDLASSAEREKDIRYSSRSRSVTDSYRHLHNVRHNINTLLEKLPPALRASPEAAYLYEFGCVTTMDIVNLTYRPSETQGACKDFEFGHSAMKARWQQGYDDGAANLRQSPWLRPMRSGTGARVFDILNPLHHREQTTLHMPKTPD